MDNLTERETWKTYWDNYLPELVSSTNQFSRLFENIADGNGQKEFIEIGGFPGTFAIYFKKFKNYKVTLLDYFIEEKHVNDLLQVNGFSKSDITILEADLFNHQLSLKYDLVFSSGLIEHFEDTKNVISKHIDFLKSDGKLLITLPNFRGLNGWVQKALHKEMYDIHNIKCMNIGYLKEICGQLPLKNIRVDYFGKPMLWLEYNAPVSKLTRRLVWFASMAMKFVPFKSRLISPYIYIEADMA